MTTREYWLNLTREKIAEVYNLFSLPAAPAVAVEDVRSVAVILGSSRSGSSFLFSTLSESGAVWSPQGEETPFYRLEDLGWVDGVRQSDVLMGPWSPKTLAGTRARLLGDIGRVSNRADPRVFGAQACARLLMQWPSLELDPADVKASFEYWFAKSPQGLWSNWLEASGIDLQLYALDGFAAKSPRSFEFPDYLLEEPPFIQQFPRAAPSAEDLRNGTLLLKTSSNAYRIPFLRALFPHARFKWIVLARNPAASINGLMDGWSSGAFHSHHVAGFQPLAIKGYSDVFPNAEAWWKFDMPPQWNEFAAEDLASVCAFQWRSAYEHIFRSMDSTGDSVLRVKYEDLTASAKRAATLADIHAFLGTEPAPEFMPLLRPVMASHPPGEARWRRREKDILPHLERTEIIDLARKLNYELDTTGEFA